MKRYIVFLFGILGISSLSFAASTITVFNKSTAMLRIFSMSPGGRFCFEEVIPGQMKEVSVASDKCYVLKPEQKVGRFGSGLKEDQSFFVPKGSGKQCEISLDSNNKVQVTS